MRKINARFLAILATSVILLVGVLFGLHRLQAGNITNALLWQADQAEKDGNLDRAAKFLGRYLEFARDDLEKREHLAMIVSDPAVAVTPQRRSRARFVIEQVLAKDPQRHALRMRLCEMALASRSFDVAKEHLNYLEKYNADSADAPFLLGAWHEAKNNPQAAAEQFRRAIQKNPANVEAYTRLVTLLKQLDRRQARYGAEIDALITSALEKAPHDAAVLSLASQRAHDKGDHAAALAFIEDGLKRHPHEPRLYLALARMSSQGGKRTEAVNQLQVGLQKVRKDRQHELRWSLANLLLEENRLDEAQKIATAIREQNPASADYLDARAQMQRGRWFEAAKQFERIRPALKGSRDLALQIDLYLGSCYEQMEEPSLQLTAFQRAVEAEPASFIARRGLANARWALGQTGEALQIHQELVAGTKNPEDAAARRLEYVRMLLQTSPRGKAVPRIEEELSEIEKVTPRSLELTLVRAEYLFGLGSKAKAEGLLHAALKEHPNRHEPWMLLISFADANGSADLSRQLMQTAENRFKDKADFRMAQVRHWSRHPSAESITALQQIEPAIDKFTPRDQSALLQALTEVYYFADRHADAARVLRRMLALPQHAEDVRVRMQLLEVVLLQDDDAQAREVLKEIKRIEGDGPSAADWSFGEALRLMREGRRGKKEALEQARHLLTVTAAQRPSWHAVVQARGELDELQGRFDQAIANYRRALDLGSRDPQAMKQLIHLLSQAHRYDEVDEVIARMQKVFGTTDDVVKGFVHNAYQRQDYQKAEFLARQMVAKNSQNYREHLWLGQILTASGKASPDAEQAFRRAVAIAPQQPDAWIGLVRYLAATGQHDTARGEVENIARAPLKEAMTLTLAQCCELTGALADTANHYKAAVQAQPESLVAHRAAADFFARMGRPTDAEVLYRKIVQGTVKASQEEVRIARHGLALALARMNRPAQVVEAMQLVGLRRDELGNIAEDAIAAIPEEQLVQAKVLGALNHHRFRGQAVALLESLHQKNILAAEDQFLLARLQAQHGGDWAKTRSLLKALTFNYPKNPRFLAFSAHMHIRHKEFTEAEQSIARLEQLERDRKMTAGGFGSIELRAKALELRGLGSQAVVLLTSYAEQPDAGAARWLLLASLHGRLGNFREAIDLCEQVQRTGTNYHESNATAAAILRFNKPTDAQPTKTEQWLEQRGRVENNLRGALQRDPADLSLRLHLADVLELQGKYAEVEKICREVLRDQDSNLVALNNLAWLLAVQPDKQTEAATLINRAIAKHGPRPELLDTRAVILMHQGKVDESIRDLERVVQEAPTPARHFHLSQAYERARNTSSALAHLRRANDMGLSAPQLHPTERAAYQRAMAELDKRR